MFFPSEMCEIMPREGLDSLASVEFQNTLTKVAGQGQVGMADG
jgi:hypothetical protein